MSHMNGGFIQTWTGPRQLYSCKGIRTLREYIGYRYIFVIYRSSEKNQFMNFLPFVILHQTLLFPISLGNHPHPLLIIWLNNSISHEEIDSRLLNKLINKKNAVIEFIKKSQMTDTKKYRICLIRAHIDYITAEIQDIDFQSDFRLLLSPILKQYMLKRNGVPAMNSYNILYISPSCLLRQLGEYTTL